ncbi:LysR family transcriptional regulator [Sphingomonas sp.]|uniref:LysR family transcriptional regulator n=1 Tax=Sphingomonas sp. TaxID=28214 RepID=UPI002DD6433C|nr:LysR family transcriptional regulator [Sphingomonas sp.]
MDPDLALFARIVHAGSLAGAARAAGLSPPMVSKRLARLETRLGVRLFDRTTRSLSLTPRGERFYRDVAAILSTLAEAEARVADALPQPAGPLIVSAPTSFGRLHLAPVLAPFLAAHPAIDLTLDLSDDYVDLTGIDLAIRITADPPRGYAAHRLADSRRVLCAAPAYLARRGAPADAAELAGHRLLAANGQLPWRLSGGVVIDGQSHVRTNSSEVVRELAVAGAGIALRSLWDVQVELADGRLRRVLPELEGAADIAIHAVHPRAPTRGATALVDYLKTEWTQPPWEVP